MQERLTEELADLLMRELDAKGVAIVIEASHSCMTIRGVNKPNSTFVTSAMRGVFKERLAPAPRSCRSSSVRPRISARRATNPWRAGAAAPVLFVARIAAEPRPLTTNGPGVGR